MTSKPQMNQPHTEVWGASPPLTRPNKPAMAYETVTSSPKKKRAASENAALNIEMIRLRDQSSSPSSSVKTGPES